MTGLAAVGHPRSRTTVRRALQQLVGHDYAKRHDVRCCEHGRPRAYYYATRRYGETLPSVCEDSAFLTWLWEGRMSWALWSLQLGERRAWIDNWSKRAATSQERTWLLTRPLDFVSATLRPNDPAWWEDTAG